MCVCVCVSIYINEGYTNGLPSSASKSTIVHHECVSNCAHFFKGSSDNSQNHQIIYEIVGQVTGLGHQIIYEIVGQFMGFVR